MACETESKPHGTANLFRHIPAGAINPLNAKLNPICHLLALLRGATIVDVSRLRVKAVGKK
jgi:hypothetical protein